MIFDIVFFLGHASEKVHKRCQGLGIYTNHAVIDLDASKFIAGNMCGIHTEPSNRINRCHGEDTKIIEIALYGKLYGSSSPKDSLAWSPAWHVIAGPARLISQPSAQLASHKLSAWLEDAAKGLWNSQIVKYDQRFWYQSYGKSLFFK